MLQIPAERQECQRSLDQTHVLNLVNLLQRQVAAGDGDVSSSHFWKLALPRWQAPFRNPPSSLLVPGAYLLPSGSAPAKCPLGRAPGCEGIGAHLPVGTRQPPHLPGCTANRVGSLTLPYSRPAAIARGRAWQPTRPGTSGACQHTHSMKVSQKIKKRTAIRSSNLTYEYLPEKKQKH